MLACPIGAATAETLPETLEGQLIDLHQADSRLATTAYRLLAAAEPLCSAKRPMPGLLLHAASQYPEAARPALQRLFGLGEGVAIAAVAPGSPAAASGLEAGDRVIAFDGKAPPTSEGKRARYDETAGANRLLEDALADGAITVTIERAGIRSDHHFIATIGCAARVQVRPSSSLDAGTDGDWISVSPRLIAYADSDELGFLFAHELAHVIRGHRVTLESAGAKGLAKLFGKRRALVRASEDEADVLGLWLAASAGYDPAAGPRLLRRFDKDHGPGIFSDGTHRSGAARAASLEQLVVELTSAQAAGTLPPPPAPRDLDQER